jgi:hypothetical protein
MRNAGERGHRHRCRAAQIHVRAGQDGHVSDGERLGQLDQQRQAWWQPGAAFDALQPRSGHTDQPRQHWPGQASALAQDLDPLAGSLPGKVIEHE